MNEPLRFGILGAANIARTLVRAMGESECCTAQAVASRSWTAAVEFAKEHAVPRAFEGYDALLASGEVDAIYNPLPNALHAEWTIKALEAGLPVLCEKPFTRDAAEARRVAEVARAKGLPVVEAFMYRFHPLYDAIADAIEDGVIGKVISLRAVFGFKLDDPGSILLSPDLAGGALMDIGCYGVNLARLVTGEEPLRVAALERRTTVDRSLHGLLHFPSGVLAQIECSFDSDVGSHACIAGTEGRIHIPEVWFPGEREAAYWLVRNGHEERRTTPGANAYRVMLDDFCRVVRRGGPPRWPIQDAIDNMAAIDALFTAARTGETVTRAN